MLRLLSERARRLPLLVNGWSKPCRLGLAPPTQTLRVTKNLASRRNAVLQIFVNGRSPVSSRCAPTRCFKAWNAHRICNFVLSSTPRCQETSHRLNRQRRAIEGCVLLRQNRPNAHRNGGSGRPSSAQLIESRRFESLLTISPWRIAPLLIRPSHPRNK